MRTCAHGCSHLVASFVLVLNACAPPPSLQEHDAAGVDSGPIADGDLEKEAAPDPEVLERKRRDLLAIFLEAAQTDVKNPYSVDDPEAPRRYTEAGKALLGESESLPWPSPPSIVGKVLGRLDDDTAAAALSAWVARPSTRPTHRLAAMHDMTYRPRAAQLPALRAVAMNDALAGDVFYLYGGGAMEDAVGLNLVASLQVHALSIAAFINTEETRAFLREVAVDPSKSAPNPRTMAALRCKRERVELEAQAISSLRIMALSMLNDKALLRQVAADTTATPLVRHWARQMAKDKPRGTTARATAAYNSEMEFELAHSPCR